MSYQPIKEQESFSNSDLLDASLSDARYNDHEDRYNNFPKNPKMTQFRRRNLHMEKK